LPDFVPCFFFNSTILPQKQLKQNVFY